MIVSGYAEDPGVAQLVSSGQVRFLAKPFTAAAMIAVVTEALRG